MSQGPTAENNYGAVSESFEVAHCPQLGRYLRTNRDILKGEVIFQELPLTLGPQKQSALICPGCFENPTTPCKACGWPICGDNCPKISIHQTECDALKQKDACKSPEDWVAIQDTLMLFRCLRLKHEDPEQWKNLMGMETNWEKWSKSSLVVSAQELVEKLKDSFEIPPNRYEDLEMMKVLAILDTNAYEVKMPSVNIQGCYQTASLAEHKCVPNAFKITSSKTFLLTMRALTDIPKGHHIATTYCDILWTTFQRQRHVQWSKFFTCRCPRCVDSTELQTYISSIMCPHCPPVTPLLPSLTVPRNAVIEEDKEEEDIWTNTSKDYICQTSCGSVFASSKCESFMISAEKELQELESTFSDDSDKQEINEALEHWLAKWTVWPAASIKSKCFTRPVPTLPYKSLSSLHRSRVKYSITPLVFLHPQHALCLDACHSLFFSYSCDSPETELLVRKCDLGVHLLRSTKALFNNGISLFRGTIMYELGMAKAALFAIYIEDKDEATRQGIDLKMLADETLALLQESLEHLQYEADDQPEGQLFGLGVRQLEKLRRFFEEVLPTL